MISINHLLTLLSLLPLSAFTYTINRPTNVCYKPEINHDAILSNCGYFDNPALAPIIQTRVGGEKLDYLYNFNNAPEIKTTIPGFDLPKKPFAGYQRLHANDIKTLRETFNSDEDKSINTDKLWKLDEVAALSGMQTMPDVYLAPGEKDVEDAPPIGDVMDVEQSELTQEAADMNNVELGENFFLEPIPYMETESMKNADVSTTEGITLSSSIPSVSSEFTPLEFEEDPVTEPEDLSESATMQDDVEGSGNGDLVEMLPRSSKLDGDGGDLNVFEGLLSAM